MQHLCLQYSYVTFKGGVRNSRGFYYFVRNGGILQKNDRRTN